MNYGLVLMEDGYYEDALDYFHQAEAFTPYYSLLKSNEGIAYGAINDDANAESHFKDAINLAPDNAQGYYFFARWLEEKKRFGEATTLLQKALELNSTYMDARYLLMQIYSEQGDQTHLKSLAQETLSQFPGDPTAAGYLARNPSTGSRAPRD
jgi:Tfp pilus assembly protein PilF